jgi:hypothetical protein
MKVKITLTNCGQEGLDHSPVEIDPDDIASIATDPAIPDSGKTVVTLSNGVWYLVRENASQIDVLTQEAKG